MKPVLIVVGCIVGGFIALLLIGLAVDEGGTVPQRIERECKKAHESQGERAVLDCQLEMSVRYLKDAKRSQSDDTYGRIR